MRLAGHGLGEHRLSRAGWPDQQHAARHLGTQPAELLRMLQEPDDLLEFGLGLVDAGDIGERDAGVVLDMHLCAAAADAHQAPEAGTPGRAPHREVPDAEEDGGGHDPGKHLARPGAGNDALVGNAVPVQARRQFRFDPHRGQRGAAFVGHLQLAHELGIQYLHLRDAAFPQRLLEGVVGNLARGRHGLHERAHQQPQAQYRERPGQIAQ